MTLDDGVPNDDSALQILLEMWIYTQEEEVNTSEEQIKSSQMTEVQKTKSSESSQGSRLPRTPFTPETFTPNNF